jgi:glycosyltransferase involved in cell wall biosynthesis
MKSKLKNNIVVDVDRLKYPFTGMHQFCLHLYKNLVKSSDFDFYFYKHQQTRLPEQLQTINIKWWDIFFLKPKAQFSLWHSTSQLTKRIPLKPIKLVYTIHDLNFLYSSKPNWKKKRTLRSIQKNCDRADYLTFISNFAYQDAKKQLNISDKKYRIIYNGVAVEKFEELTVEEIPFDFNQKYLFSLGVVAEKKNVHTCVPLLQNNDLHLVISGQIADEKYREKIIESARQYNVHERVFFTGPISDKQKYWLYKNCEAFVFPSISEGFGLPPIEAMRMGKPTFLSNLTSLPEVGGTIAYYFENFEPQHMQNVLKDGLADFYQKDKASESVIWSAQFSWDKAAKEYCEVYKEVLHSS